MAGWQAYGSFDKCVPHQYLIRCGTRVPVREQAPARGADGHKHLDVEQVIPTGRPPGTAEGPNRQQTQADDVGKPGSSTLDVEQVGPTGPPPPPGSSTSAEEVSESTERMTH